MDFIGIRYERNFGPDTGVVIDEARPADFMKALRSCRTYDCVLKRFPATTADGSGLEQLTVYDRILNGRGAIAEPGYSEPFFVNDSALDQEVNGTFD